MQNPYIAAHAERVANAGKKTTTERLRETGLNTGNFLFISALRKVVVNSSVETGLKFNPAEVREKYDGIVIPAANWLKRSNDLGPLSSLIEATNLPCTVVGIGAQAFEDNSLPILPEGTKRF